MRSRWRVIVLGLPMAACASAFFACSSFEEAETTPLPERDSGGDATAAEDAPRVDATIDVAVDAGPIVNYRAAVLADAPIAYWRFMEDVSSSSLASEVGSHVFVPVTNKPTFGSTGVFGLGSGAVAFDGTLGQRVVSNTVPVRFPAAMAFEAWFYLLEATTAARGIARHSQGGYSYRVSFAPNGILFETGYSGTSYRIGTPAASSLTEWHHVVAQGATWVDIELYVDGVKYDEVSSTNNGAQATTDLSLGAGEMAEYAPGPGGKLAEVAIYDHVLAPERINAHYLAVKKP